jgi:hypothetical protein
MKRASAILLQLFQYSMMLLLFRIVVYITGRYVPLPVLIIYRACCIHIALTVITSKH